MLMMLLIMALMLIATLMLTLLVNSIANKLANYMSWKNSFQVSIHTDKLYSTKYMLSNQHIYLNSGKYQLTIEQTTFI